MIESLSLEQGLHSALVGEVAYGRNHPQVIRRERSRGRRQGARRGQCSGGQASAKEVPAHTRSAP